MAYEEKLAHKTVYVAYAFKWGPFFLVLAFFEKKWPTIPKVPMAYATLNPALNIVDLRKNSNSILRKNFRAQNGRSKQL